MQLTLRQLRRTISETIQSSTGTDEWKKQTDHWYTRGHESVVRGSGCWLYYVDSSASGAQHLTLKDAMATPPPTHGLDASASPEERADAYVANRSAKMARRVERRGVHEREDRVVWPTVIDTDDASHGEPYRRGPEVGPYVSHLSKLNGRSRAQFLSNLERQNPRVHQAVVTHLKQWSPALLDNHDDSL